MHEETLKEARAVLEAAGMTLDNVVSTSVFLQDPQRLQGNERRLRHILHQSTARPRDGAGGTFTA